eukprot:gene3615-7195_t
MSSPCTALIVYNPNPLMTIQSFEKKTWCFVGLSNQGATCYMNSLLQTLYMTPEFRRAVYLWHYDPEKDGAEEFCIPLQLQRLFGKLQISKNMSVDTISLTKSFGWEGSEVFQQQDVQELCRVLFDALEETFKGTEVENIIDNLYAGELIDYVKCIDIDYSSERKDKFLDFSLAIKPYGKGHAMNSLVDCIEYYLTPELMDGDNKYFAEEHNKKVDAIKGLKFNKLPQILSIQLKRFVYESQGNNIIQKKLNDQVRFPFILDMNKYVATSTSSSSSTPNSESIPTKNEEFEMFLEEKIFQLKQKQTQNEIINNKNNESNNNNNNNTDTNNNNNNNNNNNKENNNNVDNIMNDGNVEGEVDDDTLPNLVHYDGSKCPDQLQEENTLFEEEKQIPSKDIQKLLEEHGEWIYELYAVLIHSGAISGGHYYAYIQDLDSRKWFNFNDSVVTEIPESQVQEAWGGKIKNRSSSSKCRKSIEIEWETYDKDGSTLLLIGYNKNTNEFNPPHYMHMSKGATLSQLRIKMKSIPQLEAGFEVDVEHIRFMKLTDGAHFEARVEELLGEDRRLREDLWLYDMQKIYYEDSNIPIQDSPSRQLYTIIINHINIHISQLDSNIFDIVLVADRRWLISYLRELISEKLQIGLYTFRMLRQHASGQEIKDTGQQLHTVSLYNDSHIAIVSGEPLQVGQYRIDVCLYRCVFIPGVTFLLSNIAENNEVEVEYDDDYYESDDRLLYDDNDGKYDAKYECIETDANDNILDDDQIDMNMTVIEPPSSDQFYETFSIVVDHDMVMDTVREKISTVTANGVTAAHIRLRDRHTQYVGRIIRNGRSFRGNEMPLYDGRSMVAQILPEPEDLPESYGGDLVLQVQRWHRKSWKLSIIREIFLYGNIRMKEISYQLAVLYNINPKNIRILFLTTYSDVFLCNLNNEFPCAGRQWIDYTRDNRVLNQMQLNLIDGDTIIVQDITEHLKILNSIELNSIEISQNTRTNGNYNTHNHNNNNTFSKWSLNTPPRNNPYNYNNSNQYSSNNNPYNNNQGIKIKTLKDRQKEQEQASLDTVTTGDSNSNTNTNQMQTQNYWDDSSDSINTIQDTQKFNQAGGYALFDDIC